MSFSLFPSLFFIQGFTLFVIGFLINLHSDYLLINLRKDGETGYKIPRGNTIQENWEKVLKTQWACVSPNDL